MDNCCPAMALIWVQQPEGDLVADINLCSSCGTVHRKEPYLLPLRFPYNERCTNCSGEMVRQANEPRCARCGQSEEETRQLHVQLAQLHPTGLPLEAASALRLLNRNALALKLATAAVRWTDQLEPAMTLRLELLALMGFLDNALDEAYEWAERIGGPPMVWSLIAGLEMQAGNTRGAINALERGIHGNPEVLGLQIDYAELNTELDERQNALRGAVKALADPTHRDRALAVLVEVGERYYAGGQYAEALGACSLAKDLQEKVASLAWLRARLTASGQDQRNIVRWLEITLQLDPNNVAAQEMLAPYQKRAGWFWGR